MRANHIGGITFEGREAGLALSVARAVGFPGVDRLVDAQSDGLPEWIDAQAGDILEHDIVDTDIDAVQLAVTEAELISDQLRCRPGSRRIPDLPPWRGKQPDKLVLDRGSADLVFASICAARERSIVRHPISRMAAVILSVRMRSAKADMEARDEARQAHCDLDPSIRHFYDL